MNARRGLEVAITIGTLFLGIGQAAAVTPVINACVSFGGTVRLLGYGGYLGSEVCSPWETPINWSNTGPRGPSDAFLKDQRDNFGSQNLSPAAFTELIKLRLPSGSYVVNATAAVSAGVTYQVAQCVIRGSSSGDLSDSFQGSVGGSANSFSVIPLTTAFTLTATEDVAVACRASGNTVSSQPSTITATQVATLTKQ